MDATGLGGKLNCHRDGFVVRCGVTEEPMLSLREWQERSRAHRKRMGAFTDPARKRRGSRVPHPVEDFLFQYYPFPFSLLEKWHPVAGVKIEWPADAGRVAPHYRSRHHILEGGMVRAEPDTLSEKERARLWWIVDLLDRTAARAPNFGCHGLHEWAMVYRGTEVRHEGRLTLRLPQTEIDALVETRPIHCTHFDAYRFFAPQALGFNRVRPGLMTRADMEQPACVHANMDLYKWAAKSMPWVGSDLLADCFELAMELRVLDMQASPYDVSSFGLEAIRVETAEGRKRYECQQRRLAEQAAVLRQRLADTLRAVLEPHHTPCQPSF